MENSTLSEFASMLANILVDDTVECPFINVPPQHGTCLAYVALRDRPYFQVAHILEQAGHPNKAQWLRSMVVDATIQRATQGRTTFSPVTYVAANDWGIYCVFA